MKLRNKERNTGFEMDIVNSKGEVIEDVSFTKIGPHWSYCFPITGTMTGEGGFTTKKAVIKAARLRIKEFEENAIGWKSYLKSSN